MDMMSEWRHWFNLEQNLYHIESVLSIACASVTDTQTEISKRYIETGSQRMQLITFENECVEFPFNSKLTVTVSVTCLHSSH